MWLAQGHKAGIRTRSLSPVSLDSPPSFPDPTPQPPQLGCSPQDRVGAYPVTREVRKLSTGSKTSWLMRGRMSMSVVSERYTMIFCVRVTAASSPASLRLFSRLGPDVLPGDT